MGGWDTDILHSRAGNDYLILTVSIGRIMSKFFRFDDMTLTRQQIEMGWL